MCRQHGHHYIDLKTGRCVICSSRHYVRMPTRSEPQPKPDVRQETADADTDRR